MSCQTSLELVKKCIQLINHLLHWSVVLLCGLEAWCVVCRCRCCSVFLSISSCFFQQSSPSLCSCRLTRVQICFQLSVTHSAGQALVFGSVCPLSVYLYVIFLHTFCFPIFLPVSWSNSIALFYNIMITLQTSLISLLPFFFSLTQSRGLTSKASSTCCNSRALDKMKKKKTFYPQPK